MHKINLEIFDKKYLSNLLGWYSMASLLTKIELKKILLIDYARNNYSY